MICTRSLSLIGSVRCQLRSLSASSNEVTKSAESEDFPSDEDIVMKSVPLSPHFKPVTRESLTTATVWPHKSVIKKMYAEANKRDRDYVEKKRGDLMTNHRNIQEIIKRPEVQAFIDNLETKYLAEVPKRNKAADKARMEQAQTAIYPDCLLGLNPFSCVREEEEFEKIHDADYPLGIEDLVSTSQVVNQLVLRSPLDFAYLAKNEGILRGTGEFFKIYFGQGKASFVAKYRSFKNRGFDHNLADRSFRSKNLAAKLSERYLKHFELIADRRWDVLLDYMADFKVVEMMNSCNQAEPEAVKSWFTVNFIKNNKKPKILSHLELPYEDKTYLQVLAKFDMEVECLNFDENRNASFGPHNMVHYVVFERDINDLLSSFRIIDKVSEEDVKYYKRHKLEIK